MNWAWGQNLPPTPKLILMALADAANDSDECWPSVTIVAQKCCVSVRTVQRTLLQFESLELMAVTPRYTSGGRQTSNGYRLCIDVISNPDKLSPSSQPQKIRGDNLSGTGVTSGVTLEGDIAVSPLEPPYESSQQPPLHFPRQLTQAEREAVSQMLAEMSPSQAQELLDELQDALDCKAIKTNSVRWFRGIVQRQIAGAFTPTGGVRVAERRKSQEQARARVVESPKNEVSNRDLARAALDEVKRTIGQSKAAAKVKTSSTSEQRL
jgi:hypothetical protein